MTNFFKKKKFFWVFVHFIHLEYFIHMIIIRVTVRILSYEFNIQPNVFKSFKDIIWALFTFLLTFFLILFTCFSCAISHLVHARVHVLPPIDLFFFWTYIPYFIRVVFLRVRMLGRFAIPTLCPCYGCCEAHVLRPIDIYVTLLFFWYFSLRVSSIGTLI